MDCIAIWYRFRFTGHSSFKKAILVVELTQSTHKRKTHRQAEICQRSAAHGYKEYNWTLSGTLGSPCILQAYTRKQMKRKERKRKEKQYTSYQSTNQWNIVHKFKITCNSFKMTDGIKQCGKRRNEGLKSSGLFSSGVHYNAGLRVLQWIHWTEHGQIG